MRPGDRIETTHGVGTLEDWTLTPDRLRFGRPVRETWFWVVFDDGARRLLPESQITPRPERESGG